MRLTVIDNRTVKNMLINYRFYVLNVNNLEQKIALLEEELDGLKGQDYSKDKIQAESTESLTEKKAVEIAELKRHRDFEKLRVQAIEKAVEELDDIDGKIIKLKYLNKNTYNVTWLMVAREVGFDKDHCQKRRDKAIEKLKISLKSIA